MSLARILTAQEPANIEKAAQVLREGGLVAFPTETVYGLGADALNPKAVCRIFEVKKRPSFDPLIVHVASIDEAAGLWQDTPPLAMKLMKKFWPGPLTLVLPKTASVPDVVTADLPTVAVRMPNHDAALALIRKLGHPVAAPSANLFGYTSPTTAAAVMEDLGDRIDLVLDGGPASVGVESTVVKIDGGKCVVLRPGGVSVDELKAFAPVEIRRSAVSEEGALESPGLAKSHYAPWTPLVYFKGPYSELLKEAGRSSARLGLLAFGEKNRTEGFESVEILSRSGDLYEAASNLFRAIRKLDKMNLDGIVAEGVPSDQGIGLAIQDRLEKASGGKQFIQDILKGGPDPVPENKTSP